MDVLCTASVGLVGDVGDNKTLFREDAQLTCDACLSRTLLDLSPILLPSHCLLMYSSSYFCTTVWMYGYK